MHPSQLRILWQSGDFPYNEAQIEIGFGLRAVPLEESNWSFMLDRSHLLRWLDECTGDDVWSIEHCRSAGIPNSWIEELQEIYESGFRTDRETLYFHGKRIHQFEGILDAALAAKIGQQFGIDTKRLEALAYSRSDFVRRIREEIEEG